MHRPREDAEAVGDTRRIEVELILGLLHYRLIAKVGEHVSRPLADDARDLLDRQPLGKQPRDEPRLLVWVPWLDSRYVAISDQR